MEEGLSLYGLTDSELFWDKASDTKMLMGWSRNILVCSFRGTASLNNALSDLQVCPLHQAFAVRLALGVGMFGLCRWECSACSANTAA